MLVDLNTVMAYAEDHKIAIGSFNVPNLESIQAVTEAAEELHLPVILQHAQCHEEFNSLDVVGPIMLQFARKASVPVCVHLDHGEDLNYLRRALEMGFTSIIYDGSMLSYGRREMYRCSHLNPHHGVQGRVGYIGFKHGLNPPFRPCLPALHKSRP